MVLLGGMKSIPCRLQWIFQSSSTQGVVSSSSSLMVMSGAKSYSCFRCLAIMSFPSNRCIPRIWSFWPGGMDPSVSFLPQVLVCQVSVRASYHSPPSTIFPWQKGLPMGIPIAWSSGRRMRTQLPISAFSNVVFRRLQVKLGISECSWGAAHPHMASYPDGV